jgi:hypothetical protein
MDTFVNSLGEAGKPSSAATAETFQARTARAQEDLQIVLEYLTQRAADRPLDRQEVEEAAVLYGTPTDRLTEDQRKRIWSLVDDLATHLKPATIEGLRCAATKDRTVQVPFTLKWGVIVVFILTLLAQCYALFGAQTIAAIDKANVERIAVQEKMNKMHEANAKLLFAGASTANGQVPVEDQSKVVYKHLEWQRDTTNWADHQNFHNLYRWSAAWAAPAAWVNWRKPVHYWGCECVDDRRPCPTVCGGKDVFPNDIPEDISNMQIRYGTDALARSVIMDLQTLVLPVLYSMLGAWVWLLRERLRQITERRLRPVLTGEYAQRILLGAVLGGVVGALYTTEDIRGQLASIPLLGLAFLVGYNVELVFSLLDRMVCSIREKIEGIKPATV